MEKETSLLLPEAMMLLQSVVLSCVDKKLFPFSKSQLNLFTMLVLEGEMTMKQVARYLACSQEQATRAVAPLADAGFVERRTDSANRTRVHIRLTGKGKQFITVQRAHMREALTDKLAGCLTEEEDAALRRAAAVLCASLEKVRAAEAERERSRPDRANAEAAAQE